MPPDWEKLHALARAEVEATLAALPAPLRERARALPVTCELRPNAAHRRDGIEPDTLGLFVGPALAGIAVEHHRQGVVALGEVDAGVRVERLQVLGELVDEELFAALQVPASTGHQGLQFVDCATSNDYVRSVDVFQHQLPEPRMNLGLLVTFAAHLIQQDLNEFGVDRL